MKNNYLMCVLTLIVSLSGCQDEDTSQPQNDDYDSQNLESVLSEVIEHVRSDYCQNIADSKLIEGAISGLLKTTDPYTSYLTPDEYSRINDVNKGAFGGIGLEIMPTKQGLKVISALNDTPAQRAKILSGEMITQINGEDITKKPPHEVIRQLQGKEGSEVRLFLLSEDGKGREVVLIRSIISVNPVTYFVHKNVAYLRLSVFSEQSVDKIKEALRSFLKHDQLYGLVVDLRNNPGGVLEQAVAVTSLFLDSGTVVSVKGRQEDEREYHVKGKDRVRGLPLLILINKGSASGAEIMAAALKDHKRAILMGERTFGKGSVQTLFPLSNKGALKLTTAYFFSPKKNRIHEKGVEPDLKVDMKDDDVLFDAQHDTQLKSAFDLFLGLSVLNTKKFGSQ